MGPRLQPMVRPPLGFGHLSDQVDQDTAGDRPTGIGAFQRLLRLGVTGLAATVWVTADGLPVVSEQRRVGSDNRLVGRLRRRPLNDLTAEELPADVVGLDALLRTLDASQHVSLRLGAREAFEPALDAVVAVDPGLERRCWFRHHDLAVLADLRTRTSATLIREQNKADAEGGLERQAAALEQRDIDGLLLPHREWTGGRTTLLHRFGRLALGSGAVHERELAELVDAGIDAVHGAQVARMMAVIVEYYGTVEQLPSDNAGTAPGDPEDG